MNTRRFSLFALFVLCLCLAAQAEGLLPGEIASGKQIYTDVNGDSMTVPDQFRVSEEPDEQTILQAARLAAYYSQAREGQNVPVDYALVKYVKKPGGAKPGMVIFTHNQTVYVTPKLPDTKKEK